jgi:cellulose synthase/poly-beta-1,6-N-acetylglucosamine synthase-like glycosyltransferase
VVVPVIADRFVVVVPARDEQTTVGACAASILRSAARAGIARPHLALLVVADSCTDATATVARRAVGAAGVVIEVGAGSAGRARAIGTARGLAQFRSWPPERIWTAHTDADSVVGDDWLRQHRRVSEHGLAAVAGVVEVDSFVEHSPATARRHHAAYRGSGDDHPHVHGANLGVRADAYLAVGGWEEVTDGEDHALWNAVRRAGYRTMSTRAISVVTSGRRFGRAPLGFSGRLRSMGEAV